MKKNLIIGPYTWHDIPGTLSVEVEDIAPQDWKAPTSPVDGTPYAPPDTIDEWKQHLGIGLQGYTVNPISGQKFLLDLTSWSHLDGGTYLQMTWSHTPDHPIPLSDPRHPQHHLDRFS